MAQLRKQRGVSFRSLLLILLLVLMISGVSIFFATYTINHVGTSMERNLNITLRTDTQVKASAFNLWFSTVEFKVRQFLDRDMIRLYSVETVALSKERSAITGGMTTFTPELLKRSEELSRIQPTLETSLRTFLAENKYLSASVWDTNLNLLLFSEHADQRPDRNIENILIACIGNGKPSTSHVYSKDGSLALSTAYPIFPPQYVEDLDKEKPIAAFLVTVPVEIAFNAILNPPNQNDSMYRIFQWAQDGATTLEYLDLKTGNIMPFANWDTSVKTELPLSRRPVPDTEDVYSLGLPIDNSFLIVTHEEPASVAESFYSEFQVIMYSVVGAVIGFTCIMVIVLWWFLVGRNERDIAKSMRKLHHDVSSQQQILDGINTALSDGVVLTDTLGNVRYANESFAKMVHQAVDTLHGFKLGNFLNPDAAECLQKHLDRVVRSESALTFEEKVTIRGVDIYLQTVCTPYFGERRTVGGVVSVYRDVTKMVLEREAEKKRVLQLIQVLTMSVELVNPYLCGHSMVLGDLAESLGKHLDCNQEELETLRMAASLSQIGMISLPQDLLNKKGALTDDEREEMKTHVDKTKELLKNFDFGLPIQDTIYQMYENMDGTGYPQQLSGDDISFLSRILHVANAFCAILRPRVYRTAKTLEATLAIFDKSQSLYDARILAALREFSYSDDGKVFVEKLQNKTLTT